MGESRTLSEQMFQRVSELLESEEAEGLKCAILVSLAGKKMKIERTTGNPWRNNRKCEGPCRIRLRAAAVDVGLVPMETG